MENQSAVLHEYQGLPTYQASQIPELGDDDVLIQVEGSTINPSDLLFIDGNYFKKPLPNPCGFQGVGKVIKTGGNANQFEGKRVSFTKMDGGAWSKYVVTQKSRLYQIDEDVPINSAASGIINPLTVLGMIHQTKANKQVGIIHTAAASAVGRMLNKLCIKENLSLINIVRKQEQADLLKSEGAEHVVVTTGDWQPILKELINKLKIKVLYDALGGGEVQADIFKSMIPGSTAYVYGALESNAAKVGPGSFIAGLTIKGFYLTTYLKQISPEEHIEIAKNYSKYLKNELSSTTSKEFKLSEIQEALKYYKENMTKGKVLLRP